MHQNEEDELSQSKYRNDELTMTIENTKSLYWELQEQSWMYNSAFRLKLQKALSLLFLHIKNYQRLVITRRRRAKQRLRMRQSCMRNCFMQLFMDSQVRCLESLPLELNPFAFKQKIYSINHTSLNGINLQETTSLNGNNVQETIEKPSVRVNFYHDIVANFTEEQWLVTFHMTKKAFTLISSRLKNILYTASMSLESLMAMCIYALATGSSFRSVGMLFHKSHTYVRSALYKFVKAFLRIFEHNFLSKPISVRIVSKICDGFAKVSSLPPCVAGVLSIFELPIFADIQPGFKSYGMDRVIVQALIDDSLQFHKVQVSHQKPSLFLNAPNELTNLPARIYSDEALVHCVVAPPHYPLRSWLMQKYDQPREHYEHDFNQALQQMNIFRDVALQRLFGRWQILTSSEFIEPQSKSLIAKACCTLHNLLEECDELFSEEWSDNIDLSKYEYKEDVEEEILPTPSNASEGELRCGIKKRDTIARLINTK